MASVMLDARGLRCPQPVLKISSKAPLLKPGDVLVVTADCSTFEVDVRKWCTRMRKTLLAVTRDGDAVSAQIQF